jgi:orotidine-5'-phosphate decarboxylase
LIKGIKKKRSVVCMGLDPRMKEIRECINTSYIPFDCDDSDNSIVYAFNRMLIDAVYELIPIIKLNIAFYERHELQNVLKSTIEYAHKKGLLVILDSKRNDIGVSAEAYAESTFDIYKADACTLNGYFGYDSIFPYLTKYTDKGLFILVKTSNSSSIEFQDLFSAKIDSTLKLSRVDKIVVKDSKITMARDFHIDETGFKKGTNQYSKILTLERNYIRMARLINEWSGYYSPNLNLLYHNMGAVVGATFPFELEKIREVIPKSFILIPGYGAQGGTIDDIKYAFDDEGLGAIVNSSRGIMFAYKKDDVFDEADFDTAAKAEVIRMNNEINKEIGLK